MTRYQQFATRRLGELALDVISQPGLVVVTAPLGYGKSALVELVRAQTDGSGGIAVIEDWDRDPDSTALTDALADPDLRSVVITGRTEPDAGQPIRMQLGVSELSFDGADIAELAGRVLGDDIGPKVAPFLSSACDGWPLAVVTLLDEISTADDPVEAACDLATDDELLARILPGWPERLGPDATRSISRLSHLDCFGDGIAATLGIHDHLRAARDAGVPIVSLGDGWWRFLDLARRALAPLSTPDQELVDAAVPELIASHRPLAAIRALRSVGDDERARALACEVPAIDLDNENQQELVAVLRWLEGSGSPQRLRLREARASRHAGQLADERDALTQIEATIRAEGGQVDAELAVELLYHRAIAGGDDELADDIDAFRVAHPHAPPASMIRWRESRAIMWAQEDSDWRLVDRARAPLEQAAQEWIEQGDVTRASAAVRLAVAAPTYHIGDYREGQRLLRQILELRGLRTSDRALTLVLMCQMSAMAGDLVSFDSELLAALNLANERSVPWMKAYLHWAQMHAAAQRQQAAELEAQWQAALQGLNELREHHTGVVFGAEAAALFAQVGDHDRAAAELALAQAHRGHNELEVSMAEVVVSARVGDVERTVAGADALRATTIIPPSRMWRLVVEEAVAHTLGGDEDAARALEQRAVAQAAVLGLEDLARSLLVTPDGVPLAGPKPTGHVFVRVLGDFDVEVSGVSTALPVGHVSTLLKILAVADSGPVAEDVVVESLWPDAGADLGTRRLKNVLSRLRREVGNEAIVRSGGGLALGDAVQTDLSVFRRLAHEALDPSVDPARRLTAATEALPMLDNDLLPVDLYAEWAIDARNRLRAQASALFHYVTSREGPGPEASWLLALAARHFSDDERLMYSLARRALAEDDGAAARRAMEIAAQAADDLGVPLTEEAAELGRSVGVPARRP